MKYLIALEICEWEEDCRRKRDWVKARKIDNLFKKMLDKHKNFYKKRWWPF